MTDTQRLDKLERLEKKLRKRYWFGIGVSGGIIAMPTLTRLLAKAMEGTKGYRTLRPAIDAAPEPGRKRTTA
jgi:hypothetical protein